MEKDITIEGVRIHYDETGPEGGNPVILLHGWGCNHTTVRSIAAALESDCKVYNLDLPGHGESEEPPTVFGTSDYARIIEGFIDSLRIKNPVLIGHSFGGRTSIKVASERDDIPKMILVDAAGVKPKRSLKYYIKVYTFKTGKRVLPFILGKDLGGKIIDKWRGKAGSADYRNSSPMMRAIMSKCVNEDLRPIMPSIKTSTLLIWGENDTATPMRDAKIMEKLIPDSGMVSWPDCGHYSFLDNPGGFKAVVRSFLINKN